MSERMIGSTSPSARPNVQGGTLAAPAAQRLSHKPLKQVSTLDELFSNGEFRRRIEESLPRHLTPDRMLRTCVSAITKAPLLAKADIRTLVGAFLTCSQVGLEPNTPLQQAHLIPFRKTVWNPQKRVREEVGVDVQLIFGYPGLLELCYRSPLITNIEAHVAFEGDVFEFEYGTNSHLRHIPRGGEARGASPIAAYMVAKLKDGFAFEVLPWPDVMRIRNSSQAYRLALSSKEEADSKGRRPPMAWTEAPWVKHEIAMARKTAFRSGSKWLPRSVELASAVAIDEAQEQRRNIDWGQVIDAADGDYVNAAATVADTTGDEGDGDGGEPPRQHEQFSQPPREETDRGGSVFGGHRFEDPRPQQSGDPGPQPRENEQRAQPAKQDTPQEGQPAKPKAKGKGALPAFEARLFDAYGEPADDTTYSDRATWANAYAMAWAQCVSAAMVEALAEHNEDALADARQDKRAALALDALELPTPRMKRAADDPNAASQGDQGGGDSDEGDQPTTGPGDGPVDAQQGGERDEDREWAEDLVKQAKAATKEDLRQWVNNGSIRNRVQRLKGERPELGKLIEDAFAARLAKAD